MSEQAPEGGGGGGLDSAFSRKYGPLTGLQWTLVAALGGGAYIWYKRRHPSTGTGTSSTSGQATAYGYTGQPYDYGPSVSALQSEVQALQSGQGQTTGTPAATNGHQTRPVQRGPSVSPSPYGGLTGSDGSQYVYITSPEISNMLLGEGQTVYAQTAPGKFVPYQQATPAQLSATSGRLYQKLG